jgi:hypothetical protein
MKLKKYNQYVKEDLQSVDNIEDKSNRPVGRRSGSPSPDFSKPKGIFDEDENDMTGELEGERKVGQDNLNVDELEEEEGHEYEGTKLMKSLAEKLGTEIVNNSIEYNGKKINFFSETEAFHIDKKKFKTIEEVLTYLGKN